MKPLLSRRAALLALGALAAPAHAQTPPSRAQQLARDAREALARLYAVDVKARELGAKARAILVFPRILKAGLVWGGQGGEGALIDNGQVTRFYRIAAGSFGFQAGAQTFSYALFFITSSALDYLSRSGGWSVGSGPSVVIVDKGLAKSITTTTLTQDVYAIPFGQRGLMAGTGLEGSKITEIHP